MSELIEQVARSHFAHLEGCVINRWPNEPCSCASSRIRAALRELSAKLEGAPAQATREQLVVALESEEFYSLMQAYRFAPLANQSAVVRSFEAVKQFIRERLLGGK